MPDSLLNVRRRIALKLNDTTGRVIFEPRMDEAIGAGLQETAAELHGALSWTDWLNLTANTEDYTVSVTEYLEVGMFRLKTSGTLVEKVSPQALERHRQLIVATGYPQLLCFSETEPATAVDRTTNVRVFPKPTIAEVLQGMVLAVPGLPTGADAGVIPLSELGMRALEYRAAMELANGMDAKTADELGFDKAAAAAGFAQAFERACYLERRRVRRLKRGGDRAKSVRRW